MKWTNSTVLFCVVTMAASADKLPTDLERHVIEPTRTHAYVCFTLLLTLTPRCSLYLHEGGIPSNLLYLDGQN